MKELGEVEKKFLENLDFEISLDDEPQYFVILRISEMFEAGQFEEVDNIISNIDTNKYSEDVLLGFLMICGSCERSKVPSYSSFYTKVSQTLTDRLGEENARFTLMEFDFS